MVNTRSEKKRKKRKSKKRYMDRYKKGPGRVEGEERRRGRNNDKKDKMEERKMKDRGSVHKRKNGKSSGESKR